MQSDNPRRPRLVIGDLHAPWIQPGYLRHCVETHTRWGCDPEVILIGDEIDGHALSFHTHDADLHSAGDELKRAIRALRPWYAAFQNAKVCIGNHSALWYRKAAEAGLPDAVIRSYREVLQAPAGWEWRQSWNLDGVLYVHGATSGRGAAFARMVREGQSLVMGHTHSHAGVQYQRSSGLGLRFALNVGCGIAEKARAFAYARDCPERPTIGCGVVVDRHEAHWIPMKS